MKTNDVTHSTRLFLQIIAFQLSFTASVNSQSQVNCALDFDGINDFVQFANKFPLHQTGNYTLEFWIKPRTINSNPSIFWTRIGDEDNNRYNIYQSLRVSYDYREPNSALHGLFLNTNANFGANIWTHHALVRQGNVYAAYMNGQLIGTQSDNNPNLPTAIGWTLSGRSIFPYNGLMDEIRIWNTAKTAAQIQTNYKKHLLGNEANLIGYWDFDTGGGDLLVDKTASGNHGKLGNLDAAQKPTWVAEGAPVFTTGDFTLHYAPILCNGQKTTLTITPLTGSVQEYLYSVTGGAPFSTSNIFSQLSAGNYTVLMTRLGRTASQHLTIAQPTGLHSVINRTNITCNYLNNGQITVVATGGKPPYEYALNGGTYQSSPIFNNLSAGTYQVTIKDVNNCLLNNYDIEVSRPPALNVAITQTNILCNGAATGKIFISATGGTGQKQYSKNNGVTWQGSTVFANLLAGTYPVVVKDANNCLSAVNVVIITQPTALTFITSKTNLSCNKSNDGNITITARGGTPPYQFSNNYGNLFVNNNLFTNLAAGNYGMRVKDANNCITAVQMVNLTQPNAIAFNTTWLNPVCYGETNGKIIIRNPTGGNGAPYEFRNNNNVTWQIAPLFERLGAGIYNVKVKDVNGCQSAVKIASLYEPAPMQFGISQQNVSCGNTANGVIAVSMFGGGTSPYRFTNDAGINYQYSNTFLDLRIGTYWMQVKDIKNCLSELRLVEIKDDCSETNSFNKVVSTRVPPMNILKLSPNPTFNVVETHLSCLNEGEQTFLFADMFGQVHQRETRYLEKGFQNVLFDCSALPKGVYEIWVLGADAKPQSSRFVKL